MPKKKAPKEPVFLLCPKCHAENGRFTEVTHELAEQWGIRIQQGGAINYDDADSMRYLGETVKVVYFQCEECGSRFDLVNGRLKKQHEVSTLEDVLAIEREDEFGRRI